LLVLAFGYRPFSFGVRCLGRPRLLGMASRRNGCLHVCSATEEIAHSPEQAGGILAYPSGRAYRPSLPAPRGGGRRPKAGRWGSRLRGGVRHPSVRGARCGARRDEHFLPDDDRRGASRSWSSEIPDRKKRSGRRYERREVRLAEWSGSGTERSARRRGPRPTGGSVVCRLRFPASCHDRGSRGLVNILDSRKATVQQQTAQQRRIRNPALNKQVKIR